MFIFRCVSCQHDHKFETINVPPSQCEKCGQAVSMLRDTEPPPPEAREPVGSFSLTRLAMVKGEAPDAAGRIFVSTAFYGLTKQLGAQGATDELTRQLEQAAAGDPDPDALPVVRAITRLRQLHDVQLHLSAGASSLARMRSRAFHDFLKSDCDVWVSIDDDVEADASTLAALVEAVQGETRVCIAPCLLREQARVNIMLDPTHDERELDSGARVVSAIAGGFGLVAMSKSAAIRYAQRYSKSLRFVDTDGREKVAVFHEVLHEGQLYGEDISFFLRTPPAVRVEALATGHTTHAGLDLDLEGFEKKRTLLRSGEQDLDEPTPVDAPELAPAGPAPTVVDGPDLNPAQHDLLRTYLTAASGGQQVQQPAKHDDAGDAPVAGEEIREEPPTRVG